MEMIVNRATGMRRNPEPRPPRHGKTAKDRDNNAHATNRANKLARAVWINETRNKVFTTSEQVPPFPG